MMRAATFAAMISVTSTMAGCAFDALDDVEDPFCTDPAYAPAEPATRTASATEGANHQRLQRMSRNGVTMNALGFNAMGFNGITFNGKHIQGKHIQGLSLQGMQLQAWVMRNGVDWQGISLQGIMFNGTGLRGVALDGTELNPDDFVGAVIPASTDADETILLTITDAERDAANPDLWRYALETADGQNLCGSERLGLFVGGIWDESGAHQDTMQVGEYMLDATFSCPRGVIAKCVTWGYEPWSLGSEVHATCTRMARADYCGDGTPHTEDGTEIDIFDTLGVQVSDEAPGFDFEAGWGPDGAVCVSHPRYEHTVDGARWVPACWSALPSCEDWESAESQGALVGNASVMTLREHSCQ